MTLGELSLETLRVPVNRGFIVHCGCRDAAFIGLVGFPVFARYRTDVEVRSLCRHGKQHCQHIEWT